MKFKTIIAQASNCLEPYRKGYTGAIHQNSGELKTKPTQHSVKELQPLGIQPDIILCRTDRLLPLDIKKKIALFCNVDVDAVITAKDVGNIYEIPLVFSPFERMDGISQVTGVGCKMRFFN